MLRWKTCTPPNGNIENFYSKTLHVHMFFVTLEGMSDIFPSNSLGSDFSIRHGGIFTIENLGNLLESAASSFWVIEICCQTIYGGDDDKNDVVSPGNAFKSNGVDECVEKDRNNSRAPCDGHTLSTKAECPDFAGISA